MPLPVNSKNLKPYIFVGRNQNNRNQFRWHLNVKMEIDEAGQIQEFVFHSVSQDPTSVRPTDIPANHPSPPNTHYLVFEVRERTAVDTEHYDCNVCAKERIGFYTIPNNIENLEVIVMDVTPNRTPRYKGRTVVIYSHTDDISPDK